MRIPRIYHPAEQPLTIATQYTLSDDAANHVGRVLRMQVGDPLQLFTGNGYLYTAVITTVSKKSVTVEVNDQQMVTNESPIAVHLGQAISRGDRMDFVLQKSVELGVTSITPLFTERCGVKLSGDRLEKKVQQWQKIVIAACEQSGRARVPTVHHPVTLAAWFAQLEPALRLTLDPYAQRPLREMELIDRKVQLVIGPEGGFTEEEVALTAAHDFIPVKLGPRVLRTETAALAALSVLQYQFGDLS
ncbi:16S rRNA (uracil(1498)-N(3))-methyltransferase [Pseudidiomarina aestuarii]|uniref:Ribosomal RNA small subunit methyltransferase E n=1 Tax=Pseudidiomarina aestuarii TaxID=624146 RepID=A0A7Z7ESI3_9GAMM|nr:16S rRNA (uracil(1498)-N(3))-methyltransferase [Pseudidiomarina aestuarii]RUO38060.1 16S rRNA (uracil(1498)-N(3))-methyltransferase [Pseudidiomarina aestuarii]